MPEDKFWGVSTPLSPFTRAVSITPSDSNQLPFITRAIYVGGAGALAVELADMAVGTSVTFAALPVGTVLHVRARRVLSTGTAATNLLAMD